jgi:hypothetical protein
MNFGPSRRDPWHLRDLRPYPLRPLYIPPIPCQFSLLYRARDQLSLRMEEKKMPFDVIAIDRAGKPAIENWALSGSIKSLRASFRPKQVRHIT